MPETTEQAGAAGNVVNWPALACYAIASAFGIWAAWRAQGDTAALSAIGTAFAGLAGYFGYKGPGIALK